MATTRTPRPNKLVSEPVSETHIRASLGDRISKSRAITALLILAGVGVLLRPGGSPSDLRTVENERREVNMMTDLLSNGKPDAIDGRFMLSTQTSIVNVTLTDPNAKLHLRSTPSEQRRGGTPDTNDDNTKIIVGDRFGDDRTLAEARSVTFDNPFIMTDTQSGESFIGGVPVQNGQKTPKIKNAEDLARQTMWVAMSQIDRDGPSSSGAQITFSASPNSAVQGPGMDSVSLVNGEVVGNNHGQLYGVAKIG